MVAPRLASSYAPKPARAERWHRYVALGALGVSLILMLSQTHITPYISQGALKIVTAVLFSSSVCSLLGVGLEK